MKKLFLSSVVGIMCSLMLSFSVAAESGANLDDLGTALPSTTTASQQVETPPAGNQTDKGSSGYIDYSELGPNADDMAAATELVAPVVKWVNIGIGILTALLGTILLASTVIDLVYIISPSFIRNIGSQSAAAATQGGMGMGGMGGAPMGGAPVATGFASLISDDCRAALDACGAPGGNSPAPAGGMGFGGGMGGFGGGFGGGMGMGMGGMGMGAPAAAPASKKLVIATYMKKRIFTFVLIGICAVLLTCTCFLDVGTKIGMWILEMVSGI